MRPLTLAERSNGDPSVSLADLLSGTRPPVSGSTHLTLEDYVREICASGFPTLQGLPERTIRVQLSSYIERIIDRDFPDMHQNVRNPRALRRWMTAYAAATATTASYDAIRDGATPGENNKPARSTTQIYRDILERIWILDPVPAWLPTRNHIHKLGATPKHHIVDPALAANLLSVTAKALLDKQPNLQVKGRDTTLLGKLFESLVTLNTRVYAQRAEARIGHLRTHSGTHEVDLIVERGDHRVLAMEIKLAYTVTDSDVRHLHWLSDQLGDDLLDAVIITTGKEAYRRQDGIAVIPAALLGP